MADDQANADEGADPSADIKKQNPGGTTTAEIVCSRQQRHREARR